MTSGKEFIDSLNRGAPGGGPPPSNGLDWVAIVKVVLVLTCEMGLTVLHYAVYSETLSIMPGEYVGDIPGLGFLFGGTELRVNHLVAAALAVVTVATPVVAFYLLLKHRVFSEPGGFLAHVPHRVYLGVLALFWAIILATELSNVVALIDGYVNNPFNSGPAAEALREVADYALLVAAVVAIVNAAVALFTASLWHSILSRRGH